ncbi:apolipoprotein D-like [Zootermopsis nevadensis]|uniref:Apolipoprotein D n=1 Tax=Zootermopsis nevadensis TaxID=136037 RepID=A0A067QRW4_ZOONE|nr:apolipoprotein D-like [Zootermopsis nevadensis]KDQ71698.1 Apolipoprotein D [Zootermopsis nevadensis]
MVWLSQWLVLWVAVEAALAGSTQHCPQKILKTDFNMTEYLGEWNEILRVPNDYEEGYSCMSDRFRLSPDGATKVHSHAYNASNGAYVFLDGVVTLSQPGRFDITYSGETVWSSSYWVLGTNYNTYAVLWGCLVQNDGSIRHLSWVSSRQKTLDEDSMTEVNEVLGNNGLERSQYEDVVQTNCPAMPSAEL